jgi:hypothetical protein
MDLNESNMSTENSFANLQMGNVSDGSSTSIGAKAGSISSLDSAGSGSLPSPVSGEVDSATEQRESPEEREEGDPGNQPESTSFKTPNLPEFSSFKMPKTLDLIYLLIHPYLGHS